MSKKVEPVYASQTVKMEVEKTFLCHACQHIGKGYCANDYIDAEKKHCLPARECTRCEKCHRLLWEAYIFLNRDLSAKSRSNASAQKSFMLASGLKVGSKLVTAKPFAKTADVSYTFTPEGATEPTISHVASDSKQAIAPNPVKASKVPSVLKDAPTVTPEPIAVAPVIASPVVSVKLDWKHATTEGRIFRQPRVAPDASLEVRIQAEIEFGKKFLKGSPKHAAHLARLSLLKP